MTINFIPGEVNKSSCSVTQANWKNHHVVIYGSGNNLILVTGSISSSNKNPNPYNIEKNLQTIYLSKDPRAVDLNTRRGTIAVGYDNVCLIFKPVNEYMRVPKWTLASQVELKEGTKINCLEWASGEDELIIGASDAISLFHFYDDCDELRFKKRWSSRQSNPVYRLCVTPNAKIILATTGPYDRLVKVWTRINYGDDNTLFEISYLPHRKGTSVKEFYWRRNFKSAESAPANKIVDSSMANIKNIRGYINTANEESEVIYTLTTEDEFKVWASYESSGHNQISNWASLNLGDIFKDGDKISSALVIEHAYLASFLTEKAHENLLFRDVNLRDFDLLLVTSLSGHARVIAISNISQTPPSNIKFTHIGKDNDDFKFGRNEFPLLSQPQLTDVGLTSDYIQSKEFISTKLYPVIANGLCRVSNDDRVQALSFLVHDRIKNTLRFELLDLRQIFEPSETSGSSVGAILLSKYQGHRKSIRKLVRSNSLYTTKNLVLSISNFAEHNYIWEPLVYEENGIKIMSITRRFQLCVEQEDDGKSAEPNGIWDAAIINDIEPPTDEKRRHLVVVCEKVGHISLWDCNGFRQDDLPAKQIYRLSVENSRPKALAMTEFPGESAADIPVRQYIVVAVYEKDAIRAWKLSLKYANDKVTEIEFKDQKIANLPQEEQIHQVTKVDAFVTQSRKSLIAVIDRTGLLKSYTLDFGSSPEEVSWINRFTLATNIKDAEKINGSTVIDKFAVVGEGGYHLSIWDVDQGVLEYEERYASSSSQGRIKDLDWTFINASLTEKSTTSAILSVGFDRFVSLFTQLRYDYTNRIPTYAAIKKIDISKYTSHEIGDSIWLDDGYLVIGSGNQFFIDDRWVKLGSTGIDSTMRQLMSGYVKKKKKSKDKDKETEKQDSQEVFDDSDTVYDISHLVRVLNGPLPIYHPQFLIQALFMSQILPVQTILVRLFQMLRQGDDVTWDLGIDFEDEIHKSLDVSFTGKEARKIKPLQRRMSSSYSLDVFTKFTAELADLLTKKLMTLSLPLLTRHQQSTLVSVIAIVKDLITSASMLDDNGLRFMIGFKLFQLSAKQKRLSMRDINWALHSDSREILLSSVETYYKNRLVWENVKKTGLVYWVKTERLVKVVESVVKNEFGESRDPSGIISLLYLALRKKQILIGLWKIVQHEEKTKMIKFLSNDFTDPRWKSAALKNAFVLLGKHRYLDAAYFFLLGDKPYDCCSIIANKIGDIALAIAVAKVYCGTKTIGKEYDESLVNLIEKYVLPDAIENGDRWTTSWVFWQIDDKPLAIEALIKTPMDMITGNSSKFPHYSDIMVSAKGQSFLRDDPVLILLFNDLRSRSVSYHKGSMNISPDEEFQFVIKVARIYTRMGCDYLALLLLRSWTFSTQSLSESAMPPAAAAAAATTTTAESKDDSSFISRNGFGHEEVNRNGSGKPSNILDSFKNDDDHYRTNKAPPPAQAFEEPDMSAFNFGF
ncbi:uncharacterized protein LODBEIA_P22530 [Lodderomyces beijingensis]|uniref:RAVE complex protein Rav1 C-terminal domain-containing protein n=1 Tax=Lodderomyces beijingensis TaxID=1775926 RepID=A0ABP0ZJH7_9ASCO